MCALLCSVCICGWSFWSVASITGPAAAIRATEATWRRKVIPESESEGVCVGGCTMNYSNFVPFQLNLSFPQHTGKDLDRRALALKVLAGPPFSDRMKHIRIEVKWDLIPGKTVAASHLPQHYSRRSVVQWGESIRDL